MCPAFDVFTIEKHNAHKKYVFFECSKNEKEIISVSILSLFQKLGMLQEKMKFVSSEDLRAGS